MKKLSVNSLELSSTTPNIFSNLAVAFIHVIPKPDTLTIEALPFLSIIILTWLGISNCWSHYVPMVIKPKPDVGEMLFICAVDSHHSMD